MGGEFGLMLGASLLTFAEFMDLIIFLVYHQLLRLHKQKQEDEEQKNDAKSHPVWSIVTIDIEFIQRTYSTAGVFAVT